MSEMLSRPEYQPCDLKDVSVVFDMADELLLMPSSDLSDNDAKDISSSDHNGFLIKRSFSYIESGASSGWMWPLTETKVAVSYEKERRFNKETYRVEVVHRLERYDIKQPPLVTIYTVELYGQKQQNFYATIESLNLDVLGDSTDEWDKRQMTDFDCETLFTELGNIWNLQQIQAAENSRLAALSGDLFA